MSTPYGGKEGTEFETGKCRKARLQNSRERIALQSLCRMHEFDLNREWDPRVSRFLNPATPNSFPFASPLMTLAGEQLPVTRCNCSRLTWKSRGVKRKKRNDESIEAILFFFVHRMQNPRISSFVTPFLPISVFGFRVGNILSQPFQAIPQTGGRYSYSSWSLHCRIYIPFHRINSMELEEIP